MGVDIYASEGTLEEVGLSGNHRANAVCHGVKYSVGENWSVMPFDLVHDCAEPMGFVVSDSDDRLVFITDTGYCRYRIDGMTMLMIESNFSEEILANNVAAGRVDRSRARRVHENHMSIERVLDFLVANDTSRLREVRLLHLSSENSDEVMFRRLVQKATGLPVVIETE